MRNLHHFSIFLIPPNFTKTKTNINIQLLICWSFFDMFSVILSNKEHAETVRVYNVDDSREII